MKLKTLLLSSLSMIACSTLIQAQLSSDSKIVAQWKFDETAGTVASDVKGTSNGTLYNIPETQWVEGKVGKALNLNTGNVASYVEITDNPIIDFNASTSFSISILVKVADISGTDMNLVWKGATGKTTPDEKGHWYSILFKTNELRMAVDDDIVKSQLGFPNANQTMNMSGWNHIVGVRDRISGNLFIYLNGIKVAEMVDGTTNDISSTPLPLIIGNNNGHTRNFEGVVDELTMYNAALTGSEITELYNSYFPTNGLSSNTISGANVSSEPGVINISVTSPSFVSVYTIEGKIVSSQSVENNAFIPAIPGIYVVVINGKAVKIIVK